MRKVLLRLFRIYRQFIIKIGIKRIPFLARIFSVFNETVFRILRPEWTIVLGHKMYLDEKDMLKLSLYGVYEPFETSLIEEKTREGDVVLDIGANIGYYTLILARRVGKGGRVYAFEPDPHNFALLKKNVEVNGYNNVVLVNKAVSDRTGTGCLFLSNEATDHRIVNAGGNRISVEIGLVSLDEYFKDIPGQIDLVKIDIQGAEPIAFAGMKRLLEKSPDVKIFTEYFPDGIKSFHLEPLDYLRGLKSYGLSFFVISETRKIMSRYTDLEALSKAPVANLFCVRE